MEEKERKEEKRKEEIEELEKTVDRINEIVEDDKNPDEEHKIFLPKKEKSFLPLIKKKKKERKERNVEVQESPDDKFSKLIERNKKEQEEVQKKKKIEEKEVKKKNVLISLRDVDVKYNLGKASEFHALKNINIEIYPGEFIIFFGPSGCGKSTLMNVVAGLEPPCNGDVIVAGDDILKYDYDKMADYHTTRMGMVFQAYNLIDSLSVEDNVALPMTFKEASVKQKKKRTKELLERFDISKHAKNVPAMLSGGQQQRVGIARSLVNDPSIIFADEPVGNLDSKSASVVTKIFTALNRVDGKTLLLVTHNPEFLSMAHRVYYMKDGAIVKEEINKDIRPLEVRKEIEEETKLDDDVKIPTELKLLMKSFGGLSSGQINSMWVPLKAKMITEQVLNKYSREQTELIERAVKARLMNLSSREEMLLALDKPMKEGGAGVDKRSAEKMTERVEEILEEVNWVKEYVDKSGDVEHKEEADTLLIGIRQELMHFSKAHVKEVQIERLDKLIRLRLDNKIDKKKFTDLVGLRESAGGAGFNKRTSKKFGRELELLMLIKYGEEHKMP
ncbi:hypothetical protein C0584_02590 [Candidatus Parcubacteria bacterium]|nr:MAG: hypothetical protein C0584_02590 [Candidatus Parcubacteria bacterium]